MSTAFAFLHDVSEGTDSISNLEGNVTENSHKSFGDKCDSMIRIFSQQFFDLKDSPRELWIVYLIVSCDAFSYFLTSLILTSFLNEFGYSDTDAGFIYALYGTLTSVYSILFGFLIDKLGVKWSLLASSLILLIGRTIMALASSSFLQLVALYFFLPLGAAFSSPAELTAVRRYTGETRQAFGYSLFYTFMNIAALLSGYIVDIIRASNENSRSCSNTSGSSVSTEFAGPYRIVLFVSAGACVVMLLLSFFLREVQVSENGSIEEFKVKDQGLIIFAQEVFCDPKLLFWRFLLFVFLLTGVKQIFRHLDASLPKYMLRTIGCDAKFGSVYSINPFMIIFLVPVVTSITMSLKIKTFDQIVFGASISSLSVFFLTFSQGYWADIMFVIFLSIGEAIWSPRLYEYSSTIAPKGKEGSYISLSAVPLMLGKLLVGSTSGLLLDQYCPCFNSSCEPCCTNVLSPEQVGCSQGRIMWAIIGAMTISSPFLVLLCKPIITAYQDEVVVESMSLDNQTPWDENETPKIDEIELMEAQ